MVRATHTEMRGNPWGIYGLYTVGLAMTYLPGCLERHFDRVFIHPSVPQRHMSRWLAILPKIFEGGSSSSGAGMIWKFCILEMWLDAHLQGLFGCLWKRLTWIRAPLPPIGLTATNCGCDCPLVGKIGTWPRTISFVWPELFLSFLFWSHPAPGRFCTHVITQAQYGKAFSGQPCRWFVMKGR